MKINLTDEMAYLRGDWTVSEMSYNTINFLSELLDMIEADGRRCLEIDCAQLNSIDNSGAQYLYIWLNCLKLRGVEYELVNIAGKHEDIIPESLRYGQSAWPNPFESSYQG